MKRKPRIIRPTNKERKNKLRGRESLDTFDGLIAHALQGNTEPLCEYITSHFPDEEHLWIRWLIRAGLQHGRKGRPKGTTGRTAKTPFHIEAQDAALAVRKSKDKWRSEYRRRHVPKVESAKMIACEIDARPILKNADDYVAALLRAPSRIGPDRG